MRHRFYWPEIARFIQQDPIGSGINWYAYTHNNPVVFIDPEGETWYKPWTWFNKDAKDKAEPSCAQGQPPASGTDVGGLVAMGAGAVAVGGVEAAKRAGHYGGALAAWGPYIQGAGLGLALVGGLATYHSTRQKAEQAGAVLANRYADPTGTGDDIWGWLEEEGLGGLQEHYAGPAIEPERPRGH